MFALHEGAISKVSESIPRKDFSTWLGVFKKSGLRFNDSPIDNGDYIAVSYSGKIEQIKFLNDNYRRLTTGVVEIDSRKSRKLRSKIKRLFCWG